MNIVVKGNFVVAVTKISGVFIMFVSFIVQKMMIIYLNGCAIFFLTDVC